MRTHLFTFTKTKRVKVVTETPAISIDLTKEEADELRQYLELGYDVADNTATPVEVAMGDLLVRLQEFTGNRSEPVKEPRKAKVGDVVYIPGDAIYGKAGNSGPWTIGSAPEAFTGGLCSWYFLDTGEPVTA